jgi:hypothetical protein
LTKCHHHETYAFNILLKHHQQHEHVKLRCDDRTIKLYNNFDAMIIANSPCPRMQTTQDTQNIKTSQTQTPLSGIKDTVSTSLPGPWQRKVMKGVRRRRMKRS